MLLILLLNLMAAWPELHEIIHTDANDSGHQCAVTLLAHGQMESSVVESPVVVPVVPIELSPLPVFAIFNAPGDTLPPGRAPPVSSSNS